MLLSRGSPGTIWNTEISGSRGSFPEDPGPEGGTFSRAIECPRGHLDRRGTGQEGNVLNWEAKLARFPHLPVVEDRQGKGLALGMRAEVSLKAERVDGWDESFDGVQRGAWYRCILSHMPPEREKQRPRP